MSAEDTFGAPNSYVLGLDKIVRRFLKYMFRLTEWQILQYRTIECSPPFTPPAGGGTGGAYLFWKLKCQIEF